MKEQTDPKLIWNRLYTLASARRMETENKYIPAEQRASGEAYKTAKEFIAVGVNVEIPIEILNIFEPVQPIATTDTEPEGKGVLRTVIESPITIGGGILKKIGSGILHGFKLMPPEEPEKDGSGR